MTSSARMSGTDPFPSHGGIPLLTAAFVLSALSPCAAQEATADLPPDRAEELRKILRTTAPQSFTDAEELSPCTLSVREVSEARKRQGNTGQEITVPLSWFEGMKREDITRIFMQVAHYLAPNDDEEKVRMTPKLKSGLFIPLGTADDCKNSDTISLPWDILNRDLLTNLADDYILDALLKSLLLKDSPNTTRNFWIRDSDLEYDIDYWSPGP